MVALGTGPAPRTYPSIGAGPAVTDQLRLLSIGGIIGIDNLAPRQPLTFGAGNLAVVYGPNGSGKSGYTRILKKISGKAGAADLKSNVYEPTPEKSECTITYDLNGSEIPHTWEANSDPVSALKAVDIFDSASGRVYLESETEVSYKPAELVLYADLVAVCNRVDTIFKGEQSLLVNALPTIPPKFQTTQVAQLFGVLCATTSDALITSQFEWIEGDEKILGELTEKLKINDPTAEAVKQRAIKREIDALKASLEIALTAVTQEECIRIKVLASESVSARTAATDGAKALSDSSKLDGIGSETWRALWGAAREYSTTEVYQGEPYPNIEDGARCVLCHQELDENSQSRLSAFEDYVSGSLESAAKTAEGLSTGAIDALPVKPSDEVLQTACQAAGLTEAVLENLKSAWAEVHDVTIALKANSLNDEMNGASMEERPLIAVLTGFSAIADVRALGYDKDAVEFDRVAATAAALELEAKQWADQQLDAIRAEVARLNRLEQYKEWRKMTRSMWLSRQAGELSATLITEAYVDRFNDELVKLGASNIRVELVKTVVVRGEVKHRIQLQGLARGGNNISEILSEILSEGEHRIISLAGFLSDVTAQPSNVPFVFDDPISSLDHEYERKVASRLVALAQSRQVIIFTHRLSLYGGVEDAARKVADNWKNNHLVQRCIESFAGTTGHPVEQSVWNSKTKTANNILITRLQDAKKEWDAGNSKLYEIHAQSICSDFRKLLERTIEDDLLSKVVLRHRGSITTENRLPHLAKISEADCVYFDSLMTKYSCYEHSQSEETPVTLPDESDLRADVEGLKTWRDNF